MIKYLNEKILNLNNKYYIKIRNIFFTNFVILIFLILLVEALFGYWLTHNFGPQMRGLRMVDYSYYNKSEDVNYIYQRDFYGFRENINSKLKYDLSKVEIIFTGGSTTDEKNKPYEKTIVGNLNKLLKNDNSDLKMYNAGVNGKTSNGHINEFLEWYDKLINFQPKLIIFYLGINDRVILNKNFKHEDFDKNLNLKKSFLYWISQNSFFAEKIKIIKRTYFTDTKYISSYDIDNNKLLNQIKSSKPIFYNDAINLYEKMTPEEERLIKLFEKRIILLIKITKQRDIEPIFITQINYNINGDRILFFLNKKLKEICFKNDLKIIKLDEIINQDISEFFYDDVHTTFKGSEFISKLIYSEIKEHLLSNKFFLKSF